MKSRPPFRLRGLESVEALGRQVLLASSRPSRLLGLAFLDREEAGAGLLIPRCRSVHTIGMRFDLDVIFIDAAGREIRTAGRVPRGRLLFERRAVAVLEVPSQGGESGPPPT